jgi:large subunit ribosomal protein L5
MARLLEDYRKNVRPRLVERLKYSNPNQVPRIATITLSMGIGEGGKDKAVLEEALEHMKAISGQSPVTTKSTKSIANFKLRKGMTVGVKVTLHGKIMYEFYDRLVSVAIPRIRDFRGLSPTLDGRGNYNLGIEDIIIFPEVNIDKVKNIKGLNITITTTAKTDEEGRALLQEMGMPFKKK